MGNITSVDIEWRVINIVADQLDKDAAGITRDTRFAEDLTTDSVTLMEVLVEIENDLSVTIPDEDAMMMRSIGNLIDYIHRRM